MAIQIDWKEQMLVELKPSDNDRELGILRYALMTIAQGNIKVSSIASPAGTQLIIDLPNPSRLNEGNRLAIIKAFATSQLELQPKIPTKK